MRAVPKRGNAQWRRESSFKMDTFSTLSPTERAAVVVHQLVTLRQSGGAGLSTAEIAGRYNLTTSGAHRLMGRISRVVPLINDGGVWRVLGGDDNG